MWNASYVQKHFSKTWQEMVNDQARETVQRNSFYVLARCNCSIWTNAWSFKRQGGFWVGHFPFQKIDMKIEAGTSRWSAVISARTLTLFVGSSVKVVDDPPARKGVNPYQKVKWKNQTATGINDEKTVIANSSSKLEVLHVFRCSTHPHPPTPTHPHPLWFILFYVSTQCCHACWHVHLIHIFHAHSAWLKTSRILRRKEVQSLTLTQVFVHIPGLPQRG